MCTVSFSTVHGLYQDCYAYRDKLTEVVVQRLNEVYEDADKNAFRIRCGDLVRKISVYKDKLAVTECHKSRQNYFDVRMFRCNYPIEL